MTVNELFENWHAGTHGFFEVVSYLVDSESHELRRTNASVYQHDTSSDFVPPVFEEEVMGK